MGKIRSLVEFDGKVGNLVGAKGKDGSYTLRKYQPRPRDGKTQEQMTMRVALANMVAQWRSMNNADRPSFESKPEGWSDFNAFISMNSGQNMVYLTKSEARMGTCIVAPYWMTSGSLPTIPASSMSGGKFKTNIALGDLVLDEDTTVSTFTKAIMNNNTGFENGDKITCILIKQTWSEYQPCKAEAIVEGVVLNKEDNTKIYDVVSDAGFSANDGYLASKSTVTGGICWVHSRKDVVSGKLLVSSQLLQVNNTLLETYMSDYQKKNAINSYGGVKYRGALYPVAEPTEAAEVNP